MTDFTNPTNDELLYSFAMRDGDTLTTKGGSKWIWQGGDWRPLQYSSGAKNQLVTATSSGSGSGKRAVEFGADVAPGSKVSAASNLPVGAGIISFIFDDGYLSAKTIVAPVFEARGIRAGFAVPFTDVDGKDAAKFVSIADLQAMQAAGHEIGSHTYSNTSLTANTVMQPTAQYEIRGGAEKLFEVGIDCNWFVSVSSTMHADYKAHLREDYAHAYTVYKGSSINGNAIQTLFDTDPYGLHRTSLFTLWEATNPSTEASRTLARICSTIDYVRANGGWVVFSCHDPSRVWLADSLPQAQLEAVLDYAIASGVRIEPPGRAFDLMSVSTVKGRRVDHVAARARRTFAGAENLLRDTGMTSYGDTTATDWYIDKTNIGTGGASAAPLGVGTNKPLALTLDANFTAGNEVVLRNRTFAVGADGSRIGALCFSIWLMSGSSGRDANWDVSVGIRLINQSTLAQIAIFETTQCGLRDLYRRFHQTAAAVPSYGVAFIAEVFVRFKSKLPGTMAVRIMNPMLNYGTYPQAYRNGRPPVV